MRLFLAGLLLLLALPARTGEFDHFLPKSLKGIKRVGCRVSPAQVIEEQKRAREVWAARVWAEYANGDRWPDADDLTISYRKTRKKALLDCDAWMETARERVKKGAR